MYSKIVSVGVDSKGQRPVGQQCWPQLHHPAHAVARTISRWWWWWSTQVYPGQEHTQRQSDGNPSCSIVKAAAQPSRSSKQSKSCFCCSSQPSARRSTSSSSSLPFTLFKAVCSDCQKLAVVRQNFPNAREKEKERERERENEKEFSRSAIGCAGLITFYPVPYCMCICII